MDVNNIFSVSEPQFLSLSIEMAKIQYQENKVYQRWCDLMGVDISQVKTLSSIPSLPISFFKTETITAGFFIPEAIFESSGTTQTQTSRHLVKHLSLYEESFMSAFIQFYGNPEEWCILGLLPAYLERTNSSLVVMVYALIKKSKKSNHLFLVSNYIIEFVWKL